MFFLVKIRYSYLGLIDKKEESIDILEGSRELAHIYCREVAQEFSNAGYDVNIELNETNIIKLY